MDFNSRDRDRNQLAPTIDHLVPRYKGGTNDEVNLKLAHRYCNERKGHREVSAQLRASMRRVVKKNLVKQNVFFFTKTPPLPSLEPVMFELYCHNCNSSLINQKKMSLTEGINVVRNVCAQCSSVELCPWEEVEGKPMRRWADLREDTVVMKTYTRICQDCGNNYDECTCDVPF